MACERCRLHNTAQSVCLLGQGPIPCDVMFIGEAPGKREDDINKPFQGEAGEILDELFASIGISRKSVYITNTVRCRPPSNRKPKAPEIKACSYWMEKELERVNPKYIVLLGGTAMRNFKELGRESISSIRGRFFKIGDYSVFSMFHPASVLYDDKKKAILKVDMENFWKVAKGKKAPIKERFNPIIVDSDKELRNCYEDLEANKIISLDIETEGLSPWGTERIVILGLGTRTVQWVIPINHDGTLYCKTLDKPRMFRRLASILNERKVVTHNGKFDTLWIKVKYGVDIKVRHDTMIMSYLLDENTPNGLKYLASTYFGAPDYDISKEQKTGGASLKDLAEYNANDTYYTRKLMFLFLEKMSEDERLLRFYRKVMIPAIEVFREIEYNGVYVDQKKLDEVDEYFKTQLQDVRRKLKKHGDINWNSTQQIADLLFNQMKIKPLEMTENRKYSTSESVMKRLAKEHDIASLILKYREYFKNSSSFIGSWKDKSVDHRLHPTFNLIKVWDRKDSKGTVTGRLSCDHPNLQQVPRDPRLRSVLQAPKGWSFVEADFSQIELRIVAMISGEPAMKLAFQTGVDIHIKTAIIISGKDMSGQEGFEAKEWRKKAKATNFGFVYGMGVDTFLDYARDKYDVIFAYDEGEVIREKFFTTYSGLRPWYKRQIRMARLNGYVRCLSGRIRHLPDIHSDNKAMRSYAERQSINSPVQGLASDITLMSAVEIHETFSRDIVRLVGTVHDSILMEVRNDYLDRVVTKISKIMRSPRLLEELDIHPTVPIMAEVSVGPWGSGIARKEK